MAIYTSGVNRVTGLSGVDVDSMVDKIMTSQGARYESLYKKKTLTEWRQNAYRDVIGKFQTFQDKYFGSSASSTNFRYSQAFQNFKSTFMDSKGEESSAIEFVSSTGSGNYQIEVKDLASYDTYTTSSGTVTKEIVSAANISDIEDALNNLDDGETLSFKLSYDGLTKEFQLDKSDLEGGGLVANLQEKADKSFGANKVTVSDKDGNLTFAAVEKGHSLVISEGTSNRTGTSTIFNLDSLNFIEKKDESEEGAEEVAEEDKVYILDLGGEDEKLDKSFNVTIDGKEYTVNVELKHGDTKEKIASKINNALSKATFEGENGEEETANISGVLSFSINDDGNVEVKNRSTTEDVTISGFDTFGGGNADVTLNHTGSLKDLGFEAGQSIAVNNTSDKIGDLLDPSIFGGEDSITLNINDKEITLNKTDTMAEMLAKFNEKDTGIKLEFNSIKMNLTLTASDMGEINNIKLGNDADTQNFMNKIGFSANHTVGKDALVNIDGEDITYMSNDINVNGLKMTLKETTNGEAINAKVEDDVDKTFDLIKGFVDDYNELIKELNGMVTETRTKNGKYSYYEPLTEDEKKELSEKEVEKWEAEAKKGLLNGDSLLKSGLSSMRNILYTTVGTQSGGKIGLFSIGITSSDNMGTLKIDEEKLREAIKNNGNDIRELFTSADNGIADQMRNAIEDLVGRDGTLRAKAGITGTTSVNNNVLSKEIKNLNEKLEKEKTRLYELEMKYYKQFSAMESAVNKSNNNMDMLYSLLG